MNNKCAENTLVNWGYINKIQNFEKDSIYLRWIVSDLDVPLNEMNTLL